MTEDSVDARLERYERQLEEHRARLAAAREQLEAVEATLDEASGDRSRRRTLAAGGVAGLGLAAGAGVASGDPTGQVGTENRPVETVHVAALAGPLTGGEELTSLVGDGLAIENGTLTVDGGT